MRDPSKARKFTSRMRSFIDDKVNKNVHRFRLTGSHKAEDPLRIERICSNHTWRESLVTFIDKDFVELWPYENEKDKKLEIKTVSCEDRDNVSLFALPKF